MAENSAFVLTPSAELAVQRAEAGIRLLRETGDAAYIGRIHYELAKAAEAQSPSRGLPEDEEMRLEGNT